MKSNFTNKNINMIVNMKKLFNEDNKTMLIGLLTITIIIWLLLYIIPDFFSNLFNTFLGNIILIIVTILISITNYKYGLTFALISIILYRILQINSNMRDITNKESFELQENKISRFLQIQNTMNPHIVFDIEILKEQIDEKDLDYFLKHGSWKWTEETTILYKEAVNTNVYIRTWPQDSVNYAKKIYNEKAILQIIALETKEGQFLINGITLNDTTPILPNGTGNYGYTSGLISEMNDVIKCNIDAYGNNSFLEQIHYIGTGGFYGEQIKKKTSIDYNKLENIIPGFKFIHGKCNPCVAVNSPPDYSCPFELNNIENKNEPKQKNYISNVWKYLWGVR